MTARRSHLISFLGTSRYQPTEYVAGGGLDPDAGSCTTPFIAEAIARLLDVGAVTVLATPSARSQNGEALGRALQATVGEVAWVEIPDGRDDGELWTIFDCLRRALSGPEPKLLDITHGFRSVPFFAAGVLHFVRSVDPAAGPVQVLYGAFQAPLELDGRAVTPIWDLSAFVDLGEWTTAISTFLRTGSGTDLADSTRLLGQSLARQWAGAGKHGPRPSLDRLGKSLDRFADSFATVRVPDLLVGRGSKGVPQVEALLSAITAARPSVALAPPLAAVLDRIAELPEALERPPLDQLGGTLRLAALARTYFGMGRFSEAATILREAWVSSHATRADALLPGGEAFSRPARKVAEARWLGNQDHEARTTANVRNDLLHAGFNSAARAAHTLREDLASELDRLDECLNTDVPEAAVSATPITVELEPGRVWDFGSLPPRSIALDGAVTGPASDPAREVYSFDHHGPGVRHAMLSTCEQVRDAILVGLDPSGFRIFINDVDADSVTAVWLLMHPERLRGSRGQRVRRLVGTLGRVDALGPAIGEPHPLTARLCPPPGEVPAQAHLDAGLALLDGWWEGDSISQARPADTTRHGIWVQTTDPAELVVRHGEFPRGFVDLYRHAGFGVLYTPAPADTLAYTVGKRSEFVRFNIAAFLDDVGALEPGWGGASTVAGAPRRADGSRSRLPVDVVAELLLAAARRAAEPSEGQEP